MAFSGGTYTLPAGNPVTTNTTIESSWANTTLSDIATALSTCVLKDGTQTLTANIPMGGFKLTGLAAGSAAADSVRMSQLQGGAAAVLSGVTGTNTITSTANPTLTALATGQTWRLVPANTNTGATTLQIDSTAATNVFWNGAALIGGELRQNVPAEVFYDGTQYQLIGSAAMANVYAVPDVIRIQSSGDRTKQFAFNITGVPTAATVTMAIPATGGSTIVGDTLLQTLTNKTLTSPTISSPTINTLVTGSAVATQAQMETPTANNLLVTPANMGFHPAIPAAWGFIITSSTIQTSYPATGVSGVKNATGRYTVTTGVSMTPSFYPVLITPFDGTAPQFAFKVSQRSPTTISLSFDTDLAGTPGDPQAFSWVIFGDR